MGGSNNLDLKDELNNMSHARGTCLMARVQNQNSANLWPSSASRELSF